VNAVPNCPILGGVDSVPDQGKGKTGRVFKAVMAGLAACSSYACAIRPASAGTQMTQREQDRQPDAFLSALLDWPGEDFPSPNLTLTGRAPGKLYGGWLTIVPGSGLTGDKIRSRIETGISVVNESTDRTVVQLDTARVPTKGEGVAEYVANPVILDGLAFIDMARSGTGIFTYVLAWQGGRWVPLAIVHGPPV
jgi:hypothetical protein